MSFSNLYNDILNKKEKISLIGLGYVGMPIAVSFSRKVDVIGFDVNQAAYTDVAEPRFRRAVSHPSGIIEPPVRSFKPLPLM